MVESRLLRDTRAKNEAEAEFADFVEFLLIAIDEVPEVREAINKALGHAPPSPVAAPPPAPRPLAVRGTRTRSRGGRRG